MSQSPPGAEKHERRRNLRGKMMVRVRYVSGSRVRHSYAEDLSTGGLFIVCDDPPPIGAHIELFFIPPKSNLTIHVLAEVRWIRGYFEDAESEAPGMGVAFIGRAPGEKKRNGLTPKSSERRAVDYDLFEAEAKGTPAKPGAPTPPKRGGAAQSATAAKRESVGEEPDWARAMARRSSPAESASANAEIGALPEDDADDEPFAESRPKAKTPNVAPQTKAQAAPLAPKVSAATPAVAPPLPQSKPVQNVRRKVVSAPPAQQAAAAIAKRRTARVRMELQIDLKTESNFYVGFTENIGSGGVFVATYDMLPVDTEVLLTFTLPNRDDVFLVPGRVRWTRPFDPLANENIHPGLGVAFSNLSSEDGAAITYFIRKIRDPYFIPTDDT